MSIVVKEQNSLKKYVPFRALCSRKTLATGKGILKVFLGKLKEFGLQDPMTSYPEKRITFATDF